MRPVWPMWRPVTKATPACRARRTASSAIAMPTTWPKPLLPSQAARPGPRRTKTGAATGSMPPAAMSSRYCGTRMTPWDFRPIVSASIRWSITTSALPGVAPAASSSALPSAASRRGRLDRAAVRSCGRSGRRPVFRLREPAESLGRHARLVPALIRRRERDGDRPTPGERGQAASRSSPRRRRGRGSRGRSAGPRRLWRRRRCRPGR